MTNIEKAVKKEGEKICNYLDVWFYKDQYYFFSRGYIQADSLVELAEKIDLKVALLRKHDLKK